MSYSIKLGSEVLVSTATFAFNLPYLGKGLLRALHELDYIHGRGIDSGSTI